MTALWHDYPARWTYEHGLVLKGIERVWDKRSERHRRIFIGGY